MNKIYLSTGCFTGRINGRDPHLLSRFFEKIDSDGFELMLYDDFYADLDSIVKEYVSLGISIPAVHMNKRIGDLCSTPGNGMLVSALDLVRTDVETALALGAKKCIFHPWGFPDSDTHLQMVLERVAAVIEVGRSYGIELMPENCVCTHGTPLDGLSRLLESCDCRICMDTRAAAFHGQVESTLKTLLPERIGHFHVIDYAGAPGDWDARKVIPQPGDGNVCWNVFFAELKKAGYGGSLTMESSYMLADGVACEIFNKSIRFIRENLK